MKILLTLLAALLLSLPTVAEATRGSAPRSGDALASTATCKGKKGKKRRRGGNRPPPTPEPAPAPEPAPEPAPAAGGAESILDGGDGDLTGMSEGDSAAATAAPAGAGLRRSNRMEFDARLIKGQTATSGAVYLFQRAPRKLPPLLSMRQSYLKQIVEPVLGKEDSSEED